MPQIDPILPFLFASFCTFLSLFPFYAMGAFRINPNFGFSFKALSLTLLATFIIAVFLMYFLLINMIIMIKT